MHIRAAHAHTSRIIKNNEKLNRYDDSTTGIIIHAGELQRENTAIRARSKKKLVLYTERSNYVIYTVDTFSAS